MSEVTNDNGNTISAFEFFRRYPNERAAIEYVEQRRWPDGITCAYCESERTTRQRDYRYHQCKDCRKKFTVRTGTIFERSHISLDKWLYAMYLLQTSRKGISSLQLSKELGITQKSSWFLLHRLREACDIEASPMSGVVEVDETYIGGKRENMSNSKRKELAGRGTVGKAAVLGMRERGGDVQAEVVDDTTAETLQGKVRENVEAGSTVYTDESKAYWSLDQTYDHGTVKHSVREFVNEMAHTNGIESIWAVLKRGYNGIYHQMSRKHLTRYINEFVFRLNQGNVKIPTMTRLDSLIDGSIGKRITYKELTG